jgi:transcriptional regulator with XRE-family HTH domain
MTEEAKIVGEAVARARKKAHMSQAQLGAQVGTDEANISRLEHGRANATARTVAKIARATGQKIVLTFEPK